MPNGVGRWIMKRTRRIRRSCYPGCKHRIAIHINQKRQASTPKRHSSCLEQNSLRIFQPEQFEKTGSVIFIHEKNGDGLIQCDNGFIYYFSDSTLLSVNQKVKFRMKEDRPLCDVTIIEQLLT